MTTTISEYLGDLQISSKHCASGTTLITDAPTDNGGKGTSFSPTDLCALSLGNCIATIMGLYGKSHGLDLRGLKVETEKVMGTEPRRIAQINLTITMPAGDFSDKDKKALENTVRTCPVHHSLHPDVVQNITIQW